MMGSSASISLACDGWADWAAVGGGAVLLEEAIAAATGSPMLGTTQLLQAPLPGAQGKVPKAEKSGRPCHPPLPSSWDKRWQTPWCAVAWAERWRGRDGSGIRARGFRGPLQGGPYS